MKNWFVLGSIILLLPASTGGGKRPIAQAQFCLTAQHGAAELKNEFVAIAHDEGMDFFERGDRVEELDSPILTNEGGKLRQFPHGIEMAVNSSDDLNGFSATVSGYPSNQVVMGFGAGHDSRLAAAFARRVIARLGQKWDVHRVSGDVGMFPLNGCQSQTATLANKERAA
jgi:hypothetical protein